MAYRTSARSAPGDTAVCCVRCADLTSIAFEVDKRGDFTCSKCRLEQPVLPDASGPEIRELVLKDYDAVGSYDELTPFAKELGKDVTGAGLHLVGDGVALKVSLSINSGAVVGLDHSATTTGLPSIRLLSEMPEHVVKKDAGIIKEVQTGDAAFDDTVYIESAARDEDVLTVLSSPAVRNAVMRLLSDTGAVVLHDGGVAIYVSRTAGPFEPKGLRERLGWLRIVAGAPRPLVSENVPVPRRARIVKQIVGWTYPFALFFTIMGLAKWTPLQGAVVFGCFAAGLVLAAFMVPVWSMLLRGRSTSHREILTWRIATFTYGPLLSLGALLTINGGFDGSKERIVTMKIAEVDKGHGEDGDVWHVKTFDEQGESHLYSFSSEAKTNQLVKVGWKEGALGWRWESTDAIVIEATKP